MNYKLHYEKLISKAQNRSILKTEYKEVHHIIPKCMGGTNDKDNLIALFPEEHFLAHLLLVKIYPTHSGLLYAVKCLSLRTNGTMVRNNKMYGWLKNKYSEVCRQRFILNNPSYLPHNKLAISKRMKENNPMFNPLTILKMIESSKGKIGWSKGLTKSDSRIAKMIYDRTDEIREKNRQGRLGTKMSEESKRKLSELKKGKPLLKNGKLVILKNPNGDEIIVHHRISQKCHDLGISYRALNKFRNKVVPKSKRKNSFLREATVGWSLIDCT